MANQTISIPTDSNNSHAGSASISSAAAALAHGAAFAEVGAIIDMMDANHPADVAGATEADLDGAISAEANALRAFLLSVPVSKADAAAKISHLLQCPDLAESLPEPDMRQFLLSLQSFLRRNDH